MKYKFKGVIFDLDGTLVESKLNFKLIRETINCPLEKDILQHVEEADAQTKKRYQAIISEHEITEAKSSKWLGDAEEFVNSLKRQNTPMAIVTRNQQSAAKIKILNNQIPIQTVFTREDTKPKPYPDALLQIAAQWNLPTRDLVYVGDYKYDIMTATNANMASALLIRGDVPEYANTASLIIRSLAELHPHID